MTSPRRRLGKRLLWTMAIVLFLAAFGGSYWWLGAPPPKRIRLATGDPGGGFAHLGQAYKEQLERMPLGLNVELVPSTGSIDNLNYLRTGRADVAFVQSGVSHLVPDRRGLCALAAVNSEPLWIICRKDRLIDSLSDLKDRTIVLGPANSGTDALARQLLAEYGVTAGRAKLKNGAMGDVRRTLLQENADAAMLVCSADGAAVRELVLSSDLELLSLRNQRAIARRLPFLRELILPAGALDLENERPEDDTAMLAPITLLAARETLHPRVVEQLLIVAQHVHSPGNLLDDAGRFPTLDGVELPVHVSAERFMRTGESFLSRHLSYQGMRLFWQAQLLLLPALALLVPFWRTLPLLYTFRINQILRQHYIALREVENRIDHCDQPEVLRKQIATLDGLRADLENLSRKLPLHLQRDVYDWRLHVALVRTEAKDRLRRLETELARSSDGDEPILYSV